MQYLHPEQTEKVKDKREQHSLCSETQTPIFYLLFQLIKFQILYHAEILTLFHLYMIKVLYCNMFSSNWNKIFHHIKISEV